MGRENPSLEVLPPPSSPFNHIKVAGILSRGSRGYVVAAAKGVRSGNVYNYELYIYSSMTEAWSTKMATLGGDCNTNWDYVRSHRTDKVIAIGTDSMGWVDLWLGIIVCNLLDEDNPTAYFVQMPGPMPGNEDHFGASSARSFRDVICVGDMFKFVEIHLHRDDHQGENLGRKRIDFGWKAVTAWNLTLPSGDWSAGITADTNDIQLTDEIYSIVLPELHDDISEKLSVNDLIWYGPTLSMDEDVLYMIFRLSLDPNDQKEWQVAIDMNKNAFEIISFTAEKKNFCDPTYRPIALSKIQVNRRNLMPLA